jgi:hypothetical protein
MKKGLFTLTLLCSIIVAISAQKTVKGTVLDDKGEPLPSAAITIKGSNMSALTDFDGLFSIKAKETDTLVFSFLGYKTKVIKAYASEKMDVIMKEEPIVNEVIILTERLKYCCRCYWKPQFIEERMCQEIQPKPLESMFFDEQKNRKSLSLLLKKNVTEFNRKNENTEGVEPKKRTLVYSKKISVEGSDYLKINSLFNEPNQIALSISSPLNEIANFRIVDMAGRVLTSHQQTLLKENNTLILAHNDLPAGMYILHVQQGEQTDSRKFMVTK